MKFFYNLTFVTLGLLSAQAFSLNVDDNVPSFSLPAIQNVGDSKKASASIHDYRGKVVYVDFWASWCAPCLKSLPILDGLRTKYKTKGFEVLAINLDKNTDDAFNFLNKNPVGYPILSDTKGKMPEEFKVKGMPTAYILDRSGVIKYIHRGFKSKDKAKIEQVIIELLEKT